MDDCRNWSSLPADILSLLLQRLNNTDTDCCRLRAVCPSWRSSLSPRPPLFPLKVLLPAEGASEVNEVIKSQFEEGNCPGLYCYLIESCGRLYLVQKVVHNNFFYNDRFDEYETDYRNGDPLELKVFALACLCSSEDGGMSHYWEPITSLGDKVFFVSDYVTFSVSAHEFGWDKGNCIFFAQEGFNKSEYSIYEEEESIFYESFKSEYRGMISKYCGLYHLEDGRIITADHLTSEYTNLFWPVPTWLVGYPLK